MTLTPEMQAHRDRLDAWRSKSHAEQLAYFGAFRPEDQRAALARVAACPDRGGVLPISQQPEGCARCGELSECRRGLGAVAGRVSLRECLACCQGG